MARIIVHDTAGHPFQVQLSRELARRGHDVLHLYASRLQTPRGPLQRRDDDPDSFQVRGVATRGDIRKYDYVRRYFQEKEYAKLLIEEVKKFKPDVVLSGNAQLDVQQALQKACRRLDARFVFWVQDLLGFGAKKVLPPVLSATVGNHYVRKERTIARASDAVVVITPDFEPLMQEWGARNVHVIPNWAPLDIRPGKKSNPWSKEHDINKGFNFVYTGTLGLKHDPGLLRKLAKEFPDARVLVTSEGLGADELRKADLPNLHVLGFQDFSVYSDVLASADVLVAILEADAGIMSVPSKVLSYHCAGRPILLSAPMDNLATKTVEGAGSGLVASAGDTQRFLKSAATLFENDSARSRHGQAARSYAERTFTVDKIADRFERALDCLER